MRQIAPVLLLSFAALRAAAALINVSPGDSYIKIESAVAGDEVVIAPGTYSFRVYLTKKATTNNPKVFRLWLTLRFVAVSSACACSSRNRQILIWKNNAVIKTAISAPRTNARTVDASKPLFIQELMMSIPGKATRN